jgi:hypothetical protein
MPGEALAAPDILAVLTAAANRFTGGLLSLIVFSPFPAQTEVSEHDRARFEMPVGNDSAAKRKARR